jgi:heavy metal sensor kinase
VLVIIVTAIFPVYAQYSLSHQLYSELQHRLVSQTLHIRDVLLPYLKDGNSVGLKKKVEEIYFPEESNRFIRISTSDGKILYLSGTPGNLSFDPSKIPLYSYNTTKPSGHVEKINKNTSLLIAGISASSEPQAYTIEIGISTEFLEDALSKLVKTLFYELPFVIFIIVCGGYILIKRALNAVEVMRATAEKITFSNLRQRLPVESTGDAVEHLGKTLNQMLERLEFAFQQASQFSADASHELRTPLTIMRSELESLRSAMQKLQTPHELNDRVSSVIEEAERLSEIIEGLASIVRLDAGEAKVDLSEFDLAILGRTTLEQMQLLAEEKNLKLMVDAMYPAKIMGDAPRIKQVIVNLLDNAIKYTPPGGTITLSISVIGNNAVMIVKDNGIGISQEDMPHIFKRFYRADKARKRTAKGNGLGLSIIRAICYAHAGQVNIQSVEGVGTIVTIRLPINKPGAAEQSGAA